jgi:hypothetical protein
MDMRSYLDVLTNFEDVVRSGWSNNEIVKELGLNIELRLILHAACCTVQCQGWASTAEQDTMSYEA